MGDIELLRNVLNYHAVAAEIISPSRIKNELLLTTIVGEKVRVNVYGKNGEVSEYKSMHNTSAKLKGAYICFFPFDRL